LIHRIQTAIASSIAAKSKAIMSLLRPRRVRSANGPSALGQRKKDAHQRLEELERWSARATLLIFFGIVVDIATVLYVPHERAEIAGSLIANGLIGVGLIVEYIVILRAITASGEAQREADVRVGIAEKQAAEANARAAGALLELARLEKKMAPRVITAAGEAKIIETLALPGPIPFKVEADPASEFAFVDRLIAVLQRAGWEWKGYAVTPLGLPTGDWRGGEFPASAISGVQIRINESRAEEWWKTVEALMLALTEALGMSVSALNDPADSANACAPDAVHIQIARKL
jgi:hypothetical protein